MKKILIFFIVPLSTVLFNIVHFDTVFQWLSSFVYIFVNVTFSIVCYKLFDSNRLSTKSSKKQIIILIIALTLIDQLIKVIIHFTQSSIGIIGEIFRIKISKNTNQTAMFNLFGIELDTLLITIMKLFLIVLLIVFFMKIKNKSNNLWCAFILLLSASIANFIDSAVWGYTLDYIYFYRLVCYDLKDFYVDTAIGYLLIVFLFSHKSKNNNRIKSNAQN